MRTHSIAVVAFDRISPFHLAVPCTIFGDDRSDAGVPRFEVLVCSAERRRTLRTTGGFDISVAHGLEALLRARTIIVPSWRDPNEIPPAALLEALRAAKKRGARIVALCLGSFVLAEAGLLDGRHATTHWLWADEFARRYPAVRLDREVLYVEDGDLLTSAGTAAGIDCCLHLLRQQCGAEIANRVARRMVVPPHRQGGQAQYIEQPVRTSAQTDNFSKAMDWGARNAGQALRLDQLAARASMSRRTFTRRFRQTTGTTVGKWLLGQRVALAQRMLETSDKSIDAIAEEAGFGTPASLRQHFAATLHTTPSHYRNEFRQRS